MDEVMRPGAEPGGKKDTGVMRTAPVDRTRLQDFNVTLQKYKAGKSRLEKRVVAAEQWWKLRNESEERKKDIGWNDDFRAKSGWLHNVLVSKHADAMESYPEPLVLPREPDDRETAKTLSAVLPVILEQNKFEKTYSDAWWQKLKTGTGVYKIVWDQDKLNGLGDINISRVDLLSVFWEPGITDIQKSRYFFHVELQDNELIEQEYPQTKDKLKGNSFTLTRFLYDDNVSTEGKSAVIDVYYKVREGDRDVLHYCKYVNDIILASTENDAAGVDPERADEEWKDERQDAGYVLQHGREFMPGFNRHGAQDSKSVIRGAEGEEPESASNPGPSIPGGGEIVGNPEPSMPGASGIGAPGAMPGMPAMGGQGMLPQEPEHLGLYDHGLYPFVFDPLWPVEGSPCGYGYVDLCMNTQMQIDMLDTAFLKNAMVGATPRYFERIDGAINEAEFKDINKAIVHVNGTLDDTGIRPIDYSPLAGNYINFYQNKITEIRETSGNTESANGIYSGGVTAASSIAALQEASGKTSRDASRASYRSFAEMTNMIIELIRQFYDLPRMFRIKGEQGQQEFAMVDNSMMQPQPIGVGSVDLGYRLPVYDVKVEIQKRNAYTRTSQNELALQLYQLGFFNPQLAQPALNCLDMMDFDGKEEVVRKIEQNAALFQQMQQLAQLAMGLAQKYEPETAQALAQSLGGMGGAALPAGGGTGKPIQLDERAQTTNAGREASNVQRARQQAATAASPT